MALDLGYTLVLMLTFSRLKRLADTVAAEVDEGSVTASDYTIYVSQVPPELGATADSAEHAVEQYRAFFTRLCAGGLREKKQKWYFLGLDTEPNDPSPPVPPAAAQVSEIVFVKNERTAITLQQEVPARHMRKAPRRAARDDER